MNSQLVSFVECGHRMSKHLDGHNSDRWDNTVNLGIHINPVAVVSESCTNMSKMTKYCTKLKVKMSQISFNIDVVILVALI